MAPEEKTGNCPHQSRAKHSCLTINCNDFEKSLLGLIKHVGVFQAMCAVCVCINAGLLLWMGRGFTSQCLDIGAQYWAAEIGGRVLDALCRLNPARRLWGRDRRSKERPCQSMRHCMSV